MRLRERRGRQPAPDLSLVYCVAECGVCRFCTYLESDPFIKGRYSRYRSLLNREPIGREGKYDELYRDLWRMRCFSSWELIERYAILSLL